VPRRKFGWRETVKRTQLGWGIVHLRNTVRAFYRGEIYGRDYSNPSSPALQPATPNWLEEYFDAHKTGRGLWKWRHYFPIYDRHFSKFRGREVHIVEIGIFAGGSLDMWKAYFGDQVHIYGVDVEPSCRVYEGDGIRVFIGDQADKIFWKQFVEEVPRIDIIVDDGGHQFHQQVATFEALLPHLQPGGVYLCEDVCQRSNPFHDYCNGLARNLSDYSPSEEVAPSIFQREIDSIHLYPYVAVVEKRADLLERFESSKHGTEWQPF
jgi:hypothetical protein